MIYTKMTKLAMKLAYDAHKDQVDKSGIPYIYHPIHLAEQMKDENTTCIALLHDVVEDTNMTFDDLVNLGFNQDIINALKLLTHNKDVPYLDYVQSIKGNELAKIVKIADLRHNSDIDRLDVVDGEVLKRIKKYKEAIKLLID